MVHFFYSVGQTGMQESGHVVIATVTCSTNNGGENVIRTASDDSCSGGLGMRLQVMHERSRICRFVHAKLVTLNYNLRFLLYLMGPGLRNNEFTYHGLIVQALN